MRKQRGKRSIATMNNSNIRLLFFDDMSQCTDTEVER